MHCLHKAQMLPCVPCSITCYPDCLMRVGSSDQWRSWCYEALSCEADDLPPVCGPCTAGPAGPVVFMIGTHACIAQ
jgi:hypothetical protein